MGVEDGSLDKKGGLDLIQSERSPLGTVDDPRWFTAEFYNLKKYLIINFKSGLRLPRAHLLRDVVDDTHESSNSDAKQKSHFPVEIRLR